MFKRAILLGGGSITDSNIAGTEADIEVLAVLKTRSLVYTIEFDTTDVYVMGTCGGNQFGATLWSGISVNATMGSWSYGNQSGTVKKTATDKISLSASNTWDTAIFFKYV